MGINPYESPQQRLETQVDQPITIDERLLIQFDITLDDVMAFYRHYFAHSPTVRRQKHFTMAILCIVSAIASSSILARTPGVATVTAVVFALGTGVLYHFLHQ